MIQPAYRDQLNSAFRQGTSVYSAQWTTREGVSFTATRGAMGRGLGGEKDDGMIDGFGGETEESSSQFWISVLREDFPAALISGRRVTFSQGAYLLCQDDGKQYLVETIPEDVESPWLRFQLREL